MNAWCEQAWLSGLQAEGDNLKTFAGRLAGHANPLGEVTASQGFLRKALGFNTLDADMMFRRLKRMGAVRKVRGGHQGQPSVWALTYTPFDSTHVGSAANYDDSR